MPTCNREEVIFISVGPTPLHKFSLFARLLADCVRGLVLDLYRIGVYRLRPICLALPGVPSCVRTPTFALVQRNRLHSLIHSFILDIYIAPLQETYSEAHLA